MSHGEWSWLQTPEFNKDRGLGPATPAREKGGSDSIAVPAAAGWVTNCSSAPGVSPACTRWHCAETVTTLYSPCLLVGWPLSWSARPGGRCSKWGTMRELVGTQNSSLKVVSIYLFSNRTLGQRGLGGKWIKMRKHWGCLTLVFGAVPGELSCAQEPSQSSVQTWVKDWVTVRLMYFLAEKCYEAITVVMVVRTVAFR